MRLETGFVPSRVVVCLVVALAAMSRVILAAGDHSGQVSFGGVPVPGATVTATRGEQKVVTVTDSNGAYRLADLTEGVWTLRVEMLGFVPVVQDVTIAAGSPPLTWALTLMPFEAITQGLAAPSPELPEIPHQGLASRQAGVPAVPPAVPPAGFQRAQLNPSAGAAAAAGDPAAMTAGGDVDQGQAADGFLINGSVNNGAASPFAQLAAFGNNRRSARSLYNGGVGLLLGNSVFDARPFSFTDQQTPRPSYDNAQILGSFAGPLKIPRLLRNGPNLFLGYQRLIDHSATTQSALVPTPLERAGNFSGQGVQIVDPVTGLPFNGNVIPARRISPQAAALLNYYPEPNLEAAGRFNYQAPVLLTTHQDAAQSRFSQMLSGGRNQVFGNLAYQRTTTDTANVFGFVDSTRVSGLDAPVNWSHRFSQQLSLRVRYQFTGLTTSVTPYFANRTNVSGEAGIGGNNQDPINWGPPNLIFSSGLAGFGSPASALNRTLTHAFGAESMWSRGRHTIMVGGDIRRQQWNIQSQQDARGTFSFTGGVTGSDLADFLLGIPHSSSIAFGNADKAFRAPSYDAYVTDDWRVSPVLTVNAGMRWEYEGPITEGLARLVNLDVAPGFSAVSPVLAGDPIGPLTGQRYPASLIRPDWRGFQPRIGTAWRPVPGSSLVIRAGYGVYRNMSVYEPIALLMAQQPPFSKTLSVENSAGAGLTLANGFVAGPGATLNTFAVDPDFRVGYAQNWQLLVQRDLPASLTMTVTYLGTKGSHLMQEFLPNTYPAGAPNPCPACPSGFVNLTSGGNSNRQAGQLQLRRRLRAGLTATVQYTLSKATDDAGAFTGVTMSGSAIAQDWRHPAAEWGPSNFDQRHLLTAQLQYSSGMGVSGSSLLQGTWGALLRGWTFTSALTAGSGLPLTPVYLTSVSGTGVIGTIRPDVTGAPAGAAPAGFFLNPSAYAPPAPGAWGDAGRNSITGPNEFLLDAGLGRTFMWGDRLNLDWRVNATNVLNRVTYAAVNTTFGSPQFGLPTVANPMRKLQGSLRLRF
jgi:hypothetical protein